MSITPPGLLLALQLKGFREWDGRTQVLVCLVGAVILIVASVALVRRVGWIAILLPAVLLGSVYAMNQNSGCLEHAGDLHDVKK